MTFNIVASGLAIALGLAGVGTIGVTDIVVAQTAVEAGKVETDEALREADRLFQQADQQYRISQFESTFQSWQTQRDRSGGYSTGQYQKGQYLKHN